VKVAALAGGVGGSKLLVGLQQALPDGALTAIVNTADDAVIYDVHISPDVDIVTYWLAGRADYERGWGIAGDTFTVIDALARLGVETWFRLGDKDLATCMYRTALLRQGSTLSAVTDEIRKVLGVPSRIIPMSDDPVATRIETADGRTLEFQEYFVKERCEPQVTGTRFAGIADAKPAPGMLEALDDAELICICPSNPVVSIGPILSLPEVRELLRGHPRVVAVSPIVEGAPLKGPADQMLAATGAEVSAAGVAGMYADFCDVFVVDSKDRAEASRIAQLLPHVEVLDTIMVDHTASERLATELLRL
jgi:LPPG:FO 2-phospho-L-lactate transferase